jgi:hypothetical protein
VQGVCSNMGELHVQIGVGVDQRPDPNQNHHSFFNAHSMCTSIGTIIFCSWPQPLCARIRQSLCELPYRQATRGVQTSLEHSTSAGDLAEPPSLHATLRLLCLKGWSLKLGFDRQYDFMQLTNSSRFIFSLPQ